MRVIEQILDLARWAPSGDNSQPWRFEIVDETNVVVHAFDTRRHCVYDLEGHASQLSVGAMLETLRIAAGAHGYSAVVARRAGVAEEHPLFDVRLERLLAPGPSDPLHGVIEKRSVQRRPLSTRPVGEAAKAALLAALPPGFRALWFESFGERLKMAWLAARSAKIRLTIPEAYAVHREIIHWDKQFSETGIPDAALGTDALTTRSMRWVLSSWERVRFMNRWFGGTVMPRLQLELLPGLLCGAHFVIVGPQASPDIDSQTAAGAAVQRFWLAATRQGLQLQPQYTPLAFARYARQGLRFTDDESALRRAAQVDADLRALVADEAASAAVFMGRIGYGEDARSRSLRLPLRQLLWTPPTPT